MTTNDLLIIGGGVAGLAAGCYAQMNGWNTHLLEHNIELGGVCTSWWREGYLIDGCIQWLMGAAPGGAFRQVYDELGVTRDVELHSLERLHRYEDVAREQVVDAVRDLSHYRRDLVRLAPDDAPTISRLFDAVERSRELRHRVEPPAELETVADRVASLWELRHVAGTLVQFRGSIEDWCHREGTSAALRDYFGAVLSSRMPMIFLPVLVQQLADGQLSRPVGGSGRFRDALVHRYRELGGEVTAHTTVEEILVEHERAVGVRLTDGSTLRADAVISTAGVHETLLRLLGGRYVDRTMRKRLDEWPLYEPIVLFSLGVEMRLDGVPDTLVIRLPEPIGIGTLPNDVLYLRVFSHDHTFAPTGHSVVQAMLRTRYDFWAECGADYALEKKRAGMAILGRLERRLPGITAAVRMTDLATPLTFWRHARTWRGAYEGWLPTPTTFYSRVPRTVAGLAGLHLAGQWVEPGGGIPPALVSARQVVQLLCREHGRAFEANAPTE